MTIKKYVHFTLCCDGPCGLVLEHENPIIPAGWVTLELTDPQPKPGQAILARATYCPSCIERFRKLASIQGFTIPDFERKTKTEEVAA